RLPGPAGAERRGRILVLREHGGEPEQQLPSVRWLAIVREQRQWVGRDNDLVRGLRRVVGLGSSTTRRRTSSLLCRGPRTSSGALFVREATGRQGRGAFS